MKILSKWAKSNPWVSRIIIAISYLLLSIKAVFLGLVLFGFGGESPQWLLLIIASFFLVLYLFYPQKGKSKKVSWSYSYSRQKTHDFGLVLTYTAVIILGVNNFCVQQGYHNTAPAAATGKLIVLKPNMPNTSTEQDGWYATAKEKFRSSKKELRRELRTLKKEWRKSGKQAEGEVEKVLLILLTILGVLLLALLIAALACSLSCSGNEALATVVALLGLIGVIVLGIVVIKKILGKKPAGIPQ